MLQSSHSFAVSILVFVELALDAEVIAVPGVGEILFQSLFSWNLLLMLASSGYSDDQIQVSILVFVELALDGSHKKRKQIDQCGFNPCFRGTCS